MSFFTLSNAEYVERKWNGKYRLHIPDPGHCVFGYCSFKEDAKEWYWGDKLTNCQMERDMVQPTKMSGPVRVDLFQRWPQIFLPDRTENGPFY